jgi:hypothetical protein
MTLLDEQERVRQPVERKHSRLSTIVCVITILGILLMISPMIALYDEFQTESSYRQWGYIYGPGFIVIMAFNLLCILLCIPALARKLYYKGPSLFAVIINGISLATIMTCYFLGVLRFFH